MTLIATGVSTPSSPSQTLPYPPDPIIRRSYTPPNLPGVCESVLMNSKGIRLSDGVLTQSLKTNCRDNLVLISPIPAEQPTLGFAIKACWNHATAGNRNCVDPCSVGLGVQSLERLADVPSHAALVLIDAVHGHVEELGDLVRGHLGLAGQFKRLEGLGRGPCRYFRHR
jgi:hypothetical protein